MKKENTLVAAAKRGFTLVELLVVVAILGILGTMAMMEFGGVSEGSAETVCDSSLKTVYQAFSVYKAKNPGKTPQSIDDLCSPNEKGDRALSEDSRCDPWGTEYKLEIKSGRLVSVTSAGPDKNFGTEDDRRYPQRKSSN